MNLASFGSKPINFDAFVIGCSLKGQRAVLCHIQPKRKNSFFVCV